MLNSLEQVQRPVIRHDWTRGEVISLFALSFNAPLYCAQFRLIPGAGHAPFVSHRDAVLEAVAGFLEPDIAA